jgi:hypothetical protein
MTLFRTAWSGPSRRPMRLWARRHRAVRERLMGSQHLPDHSRAIVGLAARDWYSPLVAGSCSTYQAICCCRHDSPYAGSRANAALVACVTSALKTLSASSASLLYHTVRMMLPLNTCRVAIWSPVGSSGRDEGGRHTNPTSLVRCSMRAAARFHRSSRRLARGRGA